MLLMAFVGRAVSRDLHHPLLRLRHPCCRREEEGVRKTWSTLQVVVFVFFVFLFDFVVIDFFVFRRLRRLRRLLLRHPCLILGDVVKKENAK